MKFVLAKPSIKIPALGFFKPKASARPAEPVKAMACDFGKSKVVLVETEKMPGRIKLTRFHKFPRAADSQKDSEAILQCCETGRYTTRKVRISVKGQGVIVRFLQLPQMKHEDLKSAIAYEIDQYIPFKAHEVIWDFHVLEQNVQIGTTMGMNVLLVAVKRDELYAIIQTFQAAGLEIEFIDVDALAGINALEYFHPEDFQSPVSLIDIGTEVSTLSVIQSGKPRFIRDISFGGIDVLKRLKRKLGVSHEKALEQLELDRVPTPEAAEILKEGLADFVSELKVSLNYYLDQIPSAEPVRKLFVSGGIGYQAIALQTLSENLGFPAENLSILTKLELGVEVDADLLKKNQGLLPVPIGLCVRES